MKKLLIFLFSIASISAYAQQGSLAQSGYFSRVQDSTAYVTAAATRHTAGYIDWWCSDSSNLCWVWNGSTYVNWEPSGSGWAVTGTTNLTGDVDISLFDQLTFSSTAATVDIGNSPGGMIVYANTFKAGTQGDEAYIQINGSASADILISTADDILIAAGQTGSGHDVNITSNYGHTHITTGTDGTLWTTTGPFTINTDPGTAGYVLQSNGAGAAPTWQAPSGGGFVSPTALTDGASISITSTNNTLTTTQSAITFSDGWTGNYSDVSVTFNQTSATWTFPAGALCVVEGVASGDNTAAVTGVSGDKIELSIRDINGTNYRVVIKNFGQ